MRFYAACLASYNAGVLHGAWIEASDDVAEMQMEVNAMLRASPFPNVTVTHPVTGESVPSAEEWAIHNHEGFGGDLAEYAGLAKVAQLFTLNEVAEDHDIPLCILRDAMNDATADLDRAEEFISDRYRGTADTWADFAEEFTRDTHDMSTVPDFLQNHIDWHSMGREFEMCGDFSGIRHDGEKLYIFWNH